MVDILVTFLLWIYFLGGYVLFFSPFAVYSFFFAADREKAFQKINHHFFSSFFSFLQMIAPGLKFKIQEEIYSIQSSVIICNHLSYLDALLLIAIFEKHKTIIKGLFFKIPLFGHILKAAGHIPSTKDPALAPLMIGHVEKMGAYLSRGGNFFVFPEGTRSRDGAIGRFNKGAFTIAKRCQAPIRVLFIQNTQQLFPAGKFFFNACTPNIIKIDWIGNIEPDYSSATVSIASLMDEAKQILEGHASILRGVNHKGE